MMIQQLFDFLTNKQKKKQLFEFYCGSKAVQQPSRISWRSKKVGKSNGFDLTCAACLPARPINTQIFFFFISLYLSRANPNPITLFSSYSSHLLNEMKPNMFNFPTNHMKRFKLFKLLIRSDDGASNVLTRLRFMSLCSLNREGKKKSALCLVGWLVGCQKSAVFIMPSPQSFENPSM